MTYSLIFHMFYSTQSLNQLSNLFDSSCFPYDARSEGAPVHEKRQKKGVIFFIYPITCPIVSLIFYLYSIVGCIKREKKPHFFICRFSCTDPPSDRASYIVSKKFDFVFLLNSWKFLQFFNKARKY